PELRESEQWTGKLQTHGFIGVPAAPRHRRVPIVLQVAKHDLRAPRAPPAFRLVSNGARGLRFLSVLKWDQTGCWGLEAQRRNQDYRCGCCFVARRPLD